MEPLSQEDENFLLEPYYETPPPDEDILQLLRNVFRHKSFRRAQLDAIKSVISGRNCFVRMATGSGKSLIWQIPALVQRGQFKSITVVVCPTKSLIMDQMAKLCQLAPTGFEAISYHGDQTEKLNRFTLWLLEQCELLPNCLLVAPEALGSKYPVRQRLEEIYQSGRLARIVVDEADKFLDWGQSFRGNYYSVLKELCMAFRDIPVLAMSGSITNEVMERSIEELSMERCVLVTESLDRPNIFYDVRHKDSAGSSVEKIVRLRLKYKDGQGIVYCALVKETERMAQKLRARGITAEVYHGKLAGAVTKAALDSWMKGITKVMVATTAFGMGIDNKNVRWVIHDTMPCNIEAWHQESGRAGRDGHHAESIVYFKIQDYHKIRGVKANSFPPSSNLSLTLKPLRDMAMTMLDRRSCRRKQLLTHFHEDLSTVCDSCHYCQTDWRESWTLCDVTADAVNALNLLAVIGRTMSGNVTEKRLAQAIHGKKSRIREVHAGMLGSDAFSQGFPSGHASKGAEKDILEFLLLLIHEDILLEYSIRYSTGYKQTCVYVKRGPRAKDLLEGKLTVRIPWKEGCMRRNLGDGDESANE